MKVVKDRRVICPSETGGGTWIALNDRGVSFALINWYSVPARVEYSPISRGEVVKATCAADNPRATEKIVSGLPLERTNPFRLVAIFPGLGQITEYRWDLQKLEINQCAWQPQQWISSGFDEPAAQRERSRAFQQALEQESAGSLRWLRLLHRSHAPETGPFSTCMHRSDAATVSYTEAVVLPGEGKMCHCLGAPCGHNEQFTAFSMRTQ
jgi:hypothetical protein